MLKEDQMNELIDNVLACISEQDELDQKYFLIQLWDMNKDLSNWHDLPIKKQIGLRSAFKEIILMSEIGKLIRNNP